MKKYWVVFLLTFLVFPIGSFAQNKVAKTRTETVTEFDKKTKKDITYKEGVLKYNANGDVVEEWGYDKKGKENKHVQFEYNSVGKKNKEIHLNTKGEIKNIVEIVYDANGHKVSEIEKSADGKKVFCKRIYTYE